MLTTRQVAAQLGITTSRVRQLIRRGKLRATRHGRDYAVDDWMLRELIERRTPNPPDPPYPGEQGEQGGDPSGLSPGDPPSDPHGVLEEISTNKPGEAK